jgi:hypothetical protein
MQVLSSGCPWRRGDPWAVIGVEQERICVPNHTRLRSWYTVSIRYFPCSGAGTCWAGTVYLFTSQPLFLPFSPKTLPISSSTPPIQHSPGFSLSESLTTLPFNTTYYLLYFLSNTLKMDKIKEVSHQDPCRRGSFDCLPKSQPLVICIYAYPPTFHHFPTGNLLTC